MEITDIIKDSFMFPANNLKQLAIFIAINFVVGLLAVFGILAFAGIESNGAYAILGFVLFLIALFVGFILSGYGIDIIKAGIDLEDVAPEFDWRNDLVRGAKEFVVSIVYFIIPFIVTVIVALVTNLPGNLVSFIEASDFGAEVPASVMSGFIGSVSITLLVAVILFIIFTFIKYMADSRLANTDSLGEALNIPEAARDIQRIGIGKVVATVILIGIIVMVINALISAISQQVPELAIINIFVTPYLMFATSKATGLLYSDIA